MSIEELATAEEVVRGALSQPQQRPTPEQQQAAWVLARAWLADECSADLVVAVKEDDGEKE